MDEFTCFRPRSVKISFSGYKYHVFLSFKGADVRKSFVDHLLEALKTAGIHAFLDNERIEKGENIGLSLEKAIENSAILIPIFSSGYADSSWCLEEVRQMWKCRSTTKRLIIPLFYDVNPSCVRFPLKENGTYAEAFNKHYSKANLPGRFKSHIIDEWKAALHYVASLSGWSLHMVAGYEAKLVKRVVSDITALNCLPRPVPRNDVGLEHNVRKVKDMLALHLPDRTIRLCIWGSTGVGKTTLANAIFNELCSNFEACCFISDISGAEERGGIIGLQTQMLMDLLKVDIKVNDIDHGKSLLQFHLSAIRPLVILDNVDHRKQLNSFMLEHCRPGTKVVVTTRGSNYEWKCLQEDENLKSFGLHEARRSSKIIKASGVVPLTLEVLDAFLFDKETSDKSWIEALRMLENLTDPFKISYDSLLPSEKVIFLDIACLFIGHDTEEPSSA